jgi:hypothetical protein
MLDHGFRYHDPNDVTINCAIAICDQTLLLSYTAVEPQLPPLGCRRGASGAEIDIRPRNLIPCGG